MNLVFADTLYWIALINTRDQWHEPARFDQDSSRSFKPRHN